MRKSLILFFILQSCFFTLKPPSDRLPPCSAGTSVVNAYSQTWDELVKKIHSPVLSVSGFKNSDALYRSPNSSNIEKALAPVKNTISILYKKDPKRLRLELSRAFKKEPLQIHSLSFLAAVQKPSPEDILWFHNVFDQYRLAKFWLSLNPVYDKQLIKNLAPYYKKNFFTRRFTNYNLYWLIQYDQQKHIAIPKNILNRVNIKIVESYSFNRRRQRAFLKNLNLAILNPEKWLSSDFALTSTEIKIWILKGYFNNLNTKGIEKNKLKYDYEIWERVIQNELKQNLLVHNNVKKDIDIIFFNTLLSFKRKFSKKMHTLVESICEKEKKLKTSCFSYYIKYKKKLVFSKWRSLNDLEKEWVFLSNAKAILSLKAFQTKEFSHFLLSHRNKRLGNVFKSMQK